MLKHLLLPIGVLILISTLYCNQSSMTNGESTTDQSIPRITSSYFALVNGTIINGTGADPIINGVVIIKDQKIVDVGVISQITIPSDAVIVDVGGASILPGFINAHVHFAYDLVKLKTWAQKGVTTVRDEAIVSSRPLSEFITIRNSARSNPRLARLISAGFMITAPNGYGRLYVTSPEDARQKVLDEISQGVDLIKFSQEDGYAGQSGIPKLFIDEMNSIIRTAHELGKLVSAHITQSRYWEMVVNAGVDDVAHIAYDPVPQSVIDRMVMNNIYLVPTFTVFRNYNAPVNICVENLRRFVQAGGKVALGNDYGGGPGDFEDGIPMYEIERMAEAGMTPMQIIVASTRNAAHVSHIDNEVGTLEVGKIADLLIVGGNPLQNLNALTHIKLVIHNGVDIRTE